MKNKKSELANRKGTNISSMNNSAETVKSELPVTKDSQIIKRKTLFSKRFKLRMNTKIKTALVKLHYQRKLNKQDQILKTRKDKLQKFTINYIPLCSDEDWEAMSDFYAKNAKK
ncbi:hypothetical protein [Algoriphagus boritolerans]|uniref:Uncharacterized protein n=1 Tax=Algoriphagus boritolerans DSM 17298 = JCM 18970 TaxID=1120964 RepID=A0A1H5UGP6_9BACT|nr:hypothetical protein [Algoriphagus boritolerans]SEF73638.1 hypothetical protein SAMN03080598_01229 [Algoriphagus boritolerans DSM 17298 = JCM 18970]